LSNHHQGESQSQAPYDGASTDTYAWLTYPAQPAVVAMGRPTLTRTLESVLWGWRKEASNNKPAHLFEGAMGKQLKKPKAGKHIDIILTTC